MRGSDEPGSADRGLGKKASGRVAFVFLFLVANSLYLSLSPSVLV